MKVGGMEEFEVQEPIRVGLLIPNMRHGGAERAVARLDAAFREDQRVRPHVVLFDDSHVGYGMATRVRSLGVPSRGRLGRILQAPLALVRVHRYRRLKSELRIDVTYSFGDAANLVNVLSGGDDVKLISYRGYGGVRTDGSWFRRHIRRRVTRWISGSADIIVVVSAGLREIFRERYDQPANKLRTMHNGYDPADFPVRDPGSTVSPEPDFFLAVGSYRHEKRYDHLLHAFARANLPENITLRVYGADPVNLKNRLQALAERLGVSPRVELRDFIEDPFEEMAGAMAFVLSSESEGFPNALVEAMFCGAPVIATDCPTGPREILQQSVTSRAAAVISGVQLADYGLLVAPPGKEEAPDDAVRALARAFELYARDGELRGRMAERARVGAQRFTIDSWVADHVELFKEAEGMRR